MHTRYELVTGWIKKGANLYSLEELELDVDDPVQDLMCL